MNYDETATDGVFSSLAEYNSAITNCFLHSERFPDNTYNSFTAAFSTNAGKVFAATRMDGFLDGTAYAMHSLFFEDARVARVLGPEDTEVYVYNTMSVGCGIIVTLKNHVFRISVGALDRISVAWARR